MAGVMINSLDGETLRQEEKVPECRKRAISDLKLTKGRSAKVLMARGENRFNRFTHNARFILLGVIAHWWPPEQDALKAKSAHHRR
jgi:hypothetical protein